MISADALQQIQDVMAVSFRLPFALYDMATLKRALDLSRPLRPNDLGQALSDATRTQWSLNQSLYRLLVEDRSLRTQVLQELGETVRGLLKTKSREILLTDVLMGYQLFCFVVSPQGGTEGELLAIGGPATRSPDVTWDAIWSDFPDEASSRMLESQLAAELLNVSVRDSTHHADVVYELMTIQQTLEICLSEESPESVRQLQPVFEIFRWIAQRQRVEQGFKLLKRVIPQMSCASLIAPISSFSTAAVVTTSIEGSARTSVDVCTLTMDQVQQMTSQPGQAFSIPSHLADLHSEYVTLFEQREQDSLQESLWILISGDRSIARHVSRNREQIRAACFWAELLQSPNTQVERRTQQMYERAQGHRQEELGDLTANAENLEPSRLKKLLVDSQDVIGFRSAALFRVLPVVSAANQTTERQLTLLCEHSSVMADSQEEAERLLADEALIRDLFDRTVPCQSVTDSATAYVPIVSGNRTAGILRFQFDSPAKLAESMPLMIAQGGRLGARLPYRWFLDLTTTAIKLLQDDRDGEQWDDLASAISVGFSVSGCSVWASDRKGNYELLGRSGVTLELRQLNREGSNGLINTCLRSHDGTQHINLISDKKVEASTELISQGFRQGLSIAVLSSGQDQCLVVMLWSKSNYRLNFFSKDDMELIRFLALTMLQMRSLHELVQDRMNQYENLVTGLGHEVGTPLATIHNAIDLLEIYGIESQPRLLSDVKQLILYARGLIDNLRLFAGVLHEREQTSSTTAGRTSSIRLFADIVSPIVDTLGFHLRLAGLRISLDFVPDLFPSEFLLAPHEIPMLRSAIFNLIDNAIKYTIGTDSCIEIEGTVEGRFAELHVRNHGIGIVPGEETKIFERNARGDNAIQTSVGGLGIGLYTARLFMRRLGGDAILTRNADPTIFVLTIPLGLGRYDYRK